jgi:hypothetical protein
LNFIILNYMDLSHLSSMLSKQASIILAEKNISLTKYVESVRKKHEEDEEYSKWDLCVSF